MSATTDILIADDHARLRALLCAMCEAAGYSVASVADGAEAVEALRHDEYRLVLMDVHMPGMDGLEATRRIRRLPGPAGTTPIVAVTADTLADTRQLCLRAGMDDFLPKPINQSDLQDKLQRVLNTVVFA